MKRSWVPPKWQTGLMLFMAGFLATDLYAFSKNIADNDASSLFGSQSTISITLSSNFKSIMNDRGDDRSYHKSRLSYVDANGDTIVRKVKLKTRGNFRRDPENCKYPPVMVRFGKQQSPDPLFEGQSKLKLVTECQNEQYVLREYAIYLLYNIMSNYSYRVRLAKVTYRDRESGQDYFTRYAFFIENEKRLAERLNAEIHKPHVVQYMLVRQNVQTMALFQYMIGNNDWYVTSTHNISILKSSDFHEPIAVPYDFDFSKLVDATYTYPKDVPTYMVNDNRKYKGLCMAEQDLAAQIQIFDEKKEALENQINNTPGLTKADKKYMTSYINSFYKILHKANSLQKIFQKPPCVVEYDLSK